MPKGSKDPWSADHSEAVRSTTTGPAPPMPAPSWQGVAALAVRGGNRYVNYVLGLLGSRGSPAPAQPDAASAGPAITSMSMDQMNASFARGAYVRKSSPRWVRAMDGPPLARLEDERVHRAALRAAEALREVEPQVYKNWWELQHSPHYGLALADAVFALDLADSLRSSVDLALAPRHLSRADVEERVTEFEVAFRNQAVRLTLKALALKEQECRRYRDNPEALDRLAHALFTRFDTEERQVLTEALDRPARMQRQHDTQVAAQWGLAAVGSPTPELPPEIDRTQAQLMAERQSASGLAKRALAGFDVAAMPGFSPEKVLRASTVKDVRNYLVSFFDNFLAKSAKTRDSLSDSKHVYRLDKAVSLAMLSLGIVPGSTPALRVAHALEEADAPWESQFEAIALFALTMASVALGPAAPLALEVLNWAGMVYVAGKITYQYAGDSAAFGLDLRSADPSLFWVVLALIGAGVAVARAEEMLQELLRASGGLKGLIKSFYDTPNPASLERLLEKLEVVQLEAAQRAAIKEWALYLMHSRGSVSVSAAEMAFRVRGAEGKLVELEKLSSLVRGWSRAEGWQGADELGVLEARRAHALSRLRGGVADPQELEQILAETKAIEAELLDLEEVFRPPFDMWARIQWLLEQVKVAWQRLGELRELQASLLARASELSASELSDLQFYAQRITALGNSLPETTSYADLNPSTIRRIYQALRPQRETVPSTLGVLGHIESQMSQMLARLVAAAAARRAVGVYAALSTRVIAQIEERIAAARPLLRGAPKHLQQLASLEQRLLAERNELAQVSRASRLEPGDPAALLQPIEELGARAGAAVEKVKEIESELNALDHPSLNN